MGLDANGIATPCAALLTQAVPCAAIRCFVATIAA